MNLEWLEAVFLDRDGTIGGDESIHYPGKFSLFPFTTSVIDQLHSEKVNIFSFTNQPGIAEGKSSVHEFVNELRGFGFDDIFICPHRIEELCSCRKPNTGMLIEARDKYGLDLSNCAVIGDRWTDMLAASKTGSLKILVQTGAGKTTLEDPGVHSTELGVDFVAEDLQGALEWLANKN
ncbi:HAD-IIIA family hydrolase [Halobacillus rhizosphaerae]|uniref:HAD-IIIA family hydrolase n=1 Tax=Halobacillus rhizosphaerae TaxID=3064889 RepID=UPI00398B8EFD